MIYGIAENPRPTGKVCEIRPCYLGVNSRLHSEHMTGKKCLSGKKRKKKKEKMPIYSKFQPCSLQYELRLESYPLHDTNHRRWITFPGTTERETS